jgi:N,N-dimethylformamidase
VHKRIAFLAPTFTYLAYGNDHLWQRTDVAAGVLWPVERAERPDPADLYLAAHPELGLSLYDKHSDGSGVCYASSRRPLVNMRDDYRYWQTDAPRHFSADLELLRWLRRRGFAYDVLTDSELDADPEAVSGYQVVLTGSHPEYWSRAMLDGITAYLGSGGRIMYLGGNGFYWVTSVDRRRRHIIEVRRGNAGSRNWTSLPGECFHSTSGELGGLWRHRGRPPQQLVGIGMAAIGCRTGAPYAREPASYERDVAFIFEGVDNALIGDFGVAMGGAAGDEIDRVDFELGTPARTRVLASSRGRHDDSYWRCIEDVEETAPGLSGPTDENVRADMVYVSCEGGGAVFGVGSISWVLSLSHDDDDNAVSRITENVLREFAGPGGDADVP